MFYSKNIALFAVRSLVVATEGKRKGQAAGTQLPASKKGISPMIGGEMPGFLQGNRDQKS
jgi:hypothetical protein